MKAKTQELLNLMLWACDLLGRPTLRNLTGSYEEWAYRHGMLRQIRRLESAKMIERAQSAIDERICRLTEKARLQALGGRDPEIEWSRTWDKHWHVIMFDLPLGEEVRRNRLRQYLRSSGFGCLQKSVWIRPRPLDRGAVPSTPQPHVRSLILMEARPSGGETDEQIVAAAWDWERISKLYRKHLRVLEDRPVGPLQSEALAKAFRRWAAAEHEAFLTAVRTDPLLPECLLPADYAGRRAWQARVSAQRHVATQLSTFRA